MSSDLSILTRLYLFQLSTASKPLGEGRTLEMVLGCYLVETQTGDHILIDTGIAPDAITSSEVLPQKRSNVIEQLDALGLQPSDIGTVICTHFDIDHAGYHDSFPDAEFIVQRAHYNLARSGYPRFASARSHWDHPSLRYRLVDGDTELLPGLTMIETSGHTTGHQSVLLRLPLTGPILLAIDAVMMERLFTPTRNAWPHDENEDQLRASTQKLLDIVEREKVALVVFGHDGLQWQRLMKAPDFYE
jgi:N-acyl homoserine lactone hydrolase